MPLNRETKPNHLNLACMINSPNASHSNKVVDKTQQKQYCTLKKSHVEQIELNSDIRTS